MLETEYIVLVAIQYAVSFFIFGRLYRGWREDDRRNGRENFWLVKHYWRKIRATPTKEDDR